MKASVAFAALVVLIGGWMVAERLNHPTEAHRGMAWFSARAASDGTGTRASRWAVDPAQPGPILPPAGRSLFDFVATSPGRGGMAYDVPFPLEALVARIEERAGCAPPNAPCTRQVLIPLGRSLQRTAASPDFFVYPRVVIAVDREGGATNRSRMLLKDRLYLGYQEKANIIEVISYNEAAGRFEFQLVKDYRAAGTPRVVYANRNVCIACHQNHAPLFSRQQWDETNANPRVAALLANTRPSFYGIPARRGVEVPNAIDDSIHRANMLRVDNLLWRDGCGINEPEGTRCRAAVLLAAWQYRLSGGRGFEAGSGVFRERVVATLARNAASQWPGGLAIPNPEIPNRDPLSFPAGAAGLAMTHVSAGLEPLAPRAPLEIWQAGDANLARRFVVGLSEQIADADVRGVEARLAARGKAARETYASNCEIRRWESELRFHCRAREGAPGATMNGRVVLRAGRVESGEVGSLALAGHEPLLHLDVGGGRYQPGGGESALSITPSSQGLRSRLQDGRAIEGIELRWKAEGAGEAVVAVADDFGPLREAIAAMESQSESDAPLAPEVFGRARIMAALAARLGLPHWRDCCEDARGLPQAEADAEAPTDAGALPVAAVFQRQCTPCHQTPEPTPPNFLHGDANRVNAALAACAPRIFVRVSMWQVKPGARDKTPMPPAFALHAAGAGRGEQAPDPAVIASLRGAAAEMLRAETGRVPSVDELLVRGYENLRPCLPPGS
ncbi:MAG: hypothetical protein ABW205_09185 [Burkholderiales bacterium]